MAEKYAWEKQKGESQKAYDRFIIFRNLPPEERTLPNALDLINQNQLKKDGGNQVSLSSIKTMSVKWCWFERAELWDKHQLLQEMEEDKEEFKKNNKHFKNVFIQCLDFANDLLAQLIANVNDNALSTRISMFHTLVNVLDSVYRNYRLSCGRSTNISESTVDATLDAEVETSIVEENIFSYTDEEMDLISNIQNIDEDTQRFLDEL